MSKLKMTFDLNTLEHLGVKLYTQYPSMIAELISNSWDADAENVQIKLYDKDIKKIEIIDDGQSMDFEELNDCFLKIGRNRRMSTLEKGLSSIKNRPVLGKKGIGKLSMFGIADKITVTAIKNRKKNQFSMSYKQMKSSKGEYYPEHLIVNENTMEKSQTVIMLEHLKRKAAFFPEDLANNLSKRFNIFNDINVEIYHNDSSILKIKNKAIFSDIKEQFSWNIPEFLENKVGSEELHRYLKDNNIKGTIFTSETPLKKYQQGVVLMARNKLVQENAFFDDRSNDYFHAYIYGVLNIDFIDESDDEDNVSTDRKSLVWEGEELEKLRENLNKILKTIEKDWREKRRKLKEKEIEEVLGLDINTWQLDLNEFEKPLAKNLVNVILNNDKISPEESKNYLSHIRDVFSFETFKNYAQKLSNLGVLEDENVVKLLTDWELIEAKELAKVAEGRITTIEEFKKAIDNNLSETKVIQPFFEKFPWVLDAKMNSFERELTLSAAIKKNIIEKEAKDAEGINLLKRIDFFVTNFSNEYIIYELKTPDVKITSKMLENVIHYITYSKEYLNSDLKKEGYKVKVVLITNNIKLDPMVQYQVSAMVEKGDLIFKTYNELLCEAEQYHRQFIEKYAELEEKKRG